MKLEVNEKSEYLSSCCKATMIQMAPGIGKCRECLKEYFFQAPPPKTKAPKSEILSPGVDQIPFESLEEIGAIFAEGEIKYGLDNWKQQPDNKSYDKERTRHAIRHLILYANGDRSENHVAKVAWWAVTTIWRNKQCLPNPDL